MSIQGFWATLIWRLGEFGVSFLEYWQRSNVYILRISKQKLWDVDNPWTQRSDLRTNWDRPGPRTVMRISGQRGGGFVRSPSDNETMRALDQSTCPPLLTCYPRNIAFGLEHRYKNTLLMTHESWDSITKQASHLQNLDYWNISEKIWGWSKFSLSCFTIANDIEDGCVTC